MCRPFGGLPPRKSRQRKCANSLGRYRRGRGRMWSVGSCSRRHSRPCFFVARLEKMKQERVSTGENQAREADERRGGGTRYPAAKQSESSIPETIFIQQISFTQFTVAEIVVIFSRSLRLRVETGQYGGLLGGYLQVSRNSKNWLLKGRPSR